MVNLWFDLQRFAEGGAGGAGGAAGGTGAASGGESK